MSDPAVFLLKVTSKGAGLNPNAKVWQEMPVAPSEAVNSGPDWPTTDINEGENFFFFFFINCNLIFL